MLTETDCQTKSRIDFSARLLLFEDILGILLHGAVRFLTICAVARDMISIPNICIGMLGLCILLLSCKWKRCLVLSSALHIPANAHLSSLQWPCYDEHVTCCIL